MDCLKFCGFGDEEYEQFEKNNSNVDPPEHNLTGTINIVSLVATCKELARIAGEEICDIYENAQGDEYRVLFNDKRTSIEKMEYFKQKELELKEKEEKEYGNNPKNLLRHTKQTSLRSLDPRTEADLAANEIIVRSLRAHFPGIHIISEEGDIEYNELEEHKTAILEKAVDTLVDDNGADIIIKSQTMTQNVEDIIIWLDPLDGTKALLKGEQRAVTTLIGIADQRTKRPIAGVIHRPFTGQCIIAIVGVVCLGFGYKNNAKYHGNTFQQIMQDLPKRIALPSPRRYVVTTKIHFRDGMKKYIACCKAAKLVQAGGAGGKALLIIEGDADAFIFPQFGTKKWDTCAVEAVLLALNGTLTQPDGALLSYDSAADRQNGSGFVATLFGAEYHKTFLFPQHISNFKRSRKLNEVEGEPPFECPLLPSVKLYALISKCSDIALENGFLHSYEAKPQMIEEKNEKYFVCLAENLANKPVMAKKKDPNKKAFDPFAGPFVKGALVCDLDTGKEYKLILNKFPVLPHHSLVISTDWIRQTERLNMTEFKVIGGLFKSLVLHFDKIAAVDTDNNVLVFLNSGLLSGATQMHRHLHVLTVGHKYFLLNKIFQTVEKKGSKEEVVMYDNYSFLHGVVTWNDDFDATVLYNGYNTLLSWVLNKMSADENIDNGLLSPDRFCYNLLISRNMMMIIPRKCAVFVSNNISFAINALPFAGLVFCNSVEQMNLFKRVGITEMIESCTFGVN